MPYKTKRGTHYHMTYGCCRATISCGTEGLKPCSTCCRGAAQDGGGAEAAAPGDPGVTTIGVAGRAPVDVAAQVVETRHLGAGGLAMADATMYRLDRTLTDEERAAVDALGHGVSVMPGEWSHDGTDKTDAIVVNDAHAGHVTLRRATGLVDLGVRMLDDGLVAPPPADDGSIRDWLAGEEGGEWFAMSVARTIRPVPMGEGGGTLYEFDEPIPDRDSWLEWRMRAQRQEGVRGVWRDFPSPGNPHRRNSAIVGFAVEDGYDVIMREGADGRTRLGVRRHPDRPLLRDVADAEWVPAGDGHPRGTVMARGAAYRTPAGDATITMIIEPDQARRGRTRTTVRVDDPMLGRAVTLIERSVSGTRDEAIGQTCASYLGQARRGAGGRKMMAEYRRSLPDIARRMYEDDEGDTIVEGVTRVSDTEVEVRVLEGGYEPARRRVILSPDGTIDTYAK